MRVVELAVPVAEAELATDRLWAAGASAVEERDDGDRVVFRTVLATVDEVSRERLGTIPETWVVRFVDVDDAPAETWREFSVPIRVNGDLEIRPAWYEGPASTCPTVIEIEPAGSFGLGDHPTTRLSADAVWRSVRDGDRVLDVGCGTGVLSIAAIERGARHVVAIDVAEAAREATVANAERHGVGDRIEASCTPLAEIDGAFDLVVANILAPTLVALAPDLRRVLAPSGRLVISGILAGRHEHVLAALEPLRAVRTDVLDAWACVELAAASAGSSAG